MNVLQKRILFVLKEKDKLVSLSQLIAKLNTKDETAIKAELDLLNEEDYITVHRSPKGNLRKAQITEKGKRFFYEGNKILNKQDIQRQLDDLKEATELLNQALNASTKEEKEGFLTKLEKFQSVLNGAYQIYENVNKLL